MRSIKALFDTISELQRGLLIILMGAYSIYTCAQDYTSTYNESVSAGPTEGTKAKSGYNKNYERYKQNKDTAKLIQTLYFSSENKRKEGRYSRAFDDLWEGLFLAKESHNLFEQVRMHRRLGDLYEVYNMDSVSLEHRQEAIQKARKVIQEDPSNQEPLIGAYMEIAVKYRKLGNYNIALNYLDSCIKLNEGVGRNTLPLPFTDAEKGNIMLKMGKFQEANYYLHRALKASQKEKPSYFGNINLYIGDLQVRLHQSDSAIHYYNQGIKYMPEHSKHYPLVPEAMISLSQIYKARKRYLISYNFLMRAKEVSDSMVRVQNQGNSELFEVKNSYLRSMKAKDTFIQKQNEELKYQKLIQSRLKIIMGLILLLGGAAIYMVRIRLKLRRTLLEKKNTELGAKLKEERIHAEMEIKSKELTSYALQMIDKDTAIDELLEVLKTEAPSTHKPLHSKYKKGAKDLWHNFNLRFKEVNSEFYVRLTARHPDLSPTERKHCALIKLNFGTKEMARILNIAPHSVHISRSRIRKKIGLHRSDSLEEYIAKL